MEPEAIAARLWPGRPVQLEALGGGITNRNFKVALDGETLVLRIGGKDTELLGIDRDVEHGASLVAAELGIGPEVIAFVDGCLVTRFIEGRALPVDEMRRPETLARAAAALRVVQKDPRSLDASTPSVSCERTVPSPTSMASGFPARTGPHSRRPTPSRTGSVPARSIPVTTTC